MSLDYTRDGFPWPEQALAFHGTPALHAIERQGFRTRMMGAPEMTGGRHKRSSSLTLVPMRAVAIALGLDTLARGAKRKMTLLQLLAKLHAEAPKALKFGVVSGFNLQEVTMGTSDPVGALRPVLAKLDKGWRVVSWWPSPGIRWPLPPGSRRVSDRLWLVSPGRKIRKVKGVTVYDARRVFFALYRGTLMSRHTEEVFDPYFLGTDMGALARTKLSSIGVLEVRVAIPHVCTDWRGARRLA